MNFRAALQMAFQCGGEKVANLENPSNATEKRRFDAILGTETKEDIASAAEIESFEQFSQNEKDALLFAYCNGWTAEVRCHN